MIGSNKVLLREFSNSNSRLNQLTQGSLDVRTYFTRLKTLWDELRNYQPLPTCDCGAMKPLIDHAEQEHVMQFLKGLNDSYNGIRAQILMIDTLPSVSKIFNLVVQEERQRMIGTSPVAPTESMAFNVNSPTSGSSVTGAIGSGLG